MSLWAAAVRDKKGGGLVSGFCGRNASIPDVSGTGKETVSLCLLLSCLVNALV